MKRHLRWKLKEQVRHGVQQCIWICVCRHTPTHVPTCLNEWKSSHLNLHTVRMWCFKYLPASRFPRFGRSVSRFVMCAWVTLFSCISNLEKQTKRELVGERRVTFSWTAQCPGASGEPRWSGMLRSHEGTTRLNSKARRNGTARHPTWGRAVASESRCEHRGLRGKGPG